LRALSGGCACGQVRYECEEISIVDLICHCRDCQRASGSAYAAVSVVPTDRLRLKGELKYHSIKADSGRTMERGFCPECGSPVAIRRPETPAITFLQASSLDDPSRFSPTCEVFLSSAHAWHPTHGVESFQNGPSEDRREGPRSCLFRGKAGSRGSISQESGLARLLSTTGIDASCRIVHQTLRETRWSLRTSAIRYRWTRSSGIHILLPLRRSTRPDRCLSLWQRNPIFSHFAVKSTPTNTKGFGGLLPVSVLV
jgi:hypothetical protein